MIWLYLCLLISWFSGCGGVLMNVCFVLVCVCC